MTIPIIDIFAGPGGLSEGFSSVLLKNNRVFDVRLSIEMEENAHKTLELRSFVRKFPVGEIPFEYYRMMQEPDLEIRQNLRNLLFEKYQTQAAEARNEAWHAELGHKGFPSELVDKRIKQALNGIKNWVLIGGPPCQAYSLVGRSRRQLGENLDTDDKRVHLYKEYLRIIAAHHPAVFVMENVKGLLSSNLDGEKMFDLIKRDLKDPASVFPELNSPKYKIFSLTSEPAAFENGSPTYNNDMEFLIRSEVYGVPQKRHRVILLGIRDDISILPNTLTAADRKVTLSDVIGDLPKIRSGINRSFSHSEVKEGKKRRTYINEIDSEENWIRLINSFKREIISWNGFAKNYSDSKIQIPLKGKGAEFVPCSTPSIDNPLFGWYHDPNLKGAVNHESRSHLVQDLKRYLFSSMFTKTHNRFPRLHEFDQHSLELLPDHENVKSGKFADRFRVQVSSGPATTITSHISKDGHYFIHYDPDQCRSMTVREAARVQTFPDNYLFCGPRTAQYQQVGNAVPPYLAVQIGKIVQEIFADHSL